ncbi:MAG: flagellar brake protein [Solirubrobacterales bacterium]
MYENLIKENLRIEIRTSEEMRVGLASRVEEVRRGSMIVAHPTKQGVPAFLHPGQKVFIDYMVKDDSYHFETTIIARRREPIPVLEIAMPAQIEKKQRRNYLRFHYNIPIKFRLLESEDDLLTCIPEEDMMDGQTVDISGGGSQFVTHHVVTAGQLLEVHFQLPNRRPLALVVKVIRSVPDETGPNPKYTVASMFDRIKESHQDIIISFIFEKQRELRKKGLL